jgi:hypothetical protein
MEWKPIITAPYSKTILVRNKLMETPVRAKRGYVHNGAVHPDQSFCTSEYTPDQFFPFPAGRLVCPEEWVEFIEPKGGA